MLKNDLEYISGKYGNESKILLGNFLYKYLPLYMNIKIKIVNDKALEWGMNKGPKPDYYHTIFPTYKIKPGNSQIDQFLFYKKNEKWLNYKISNLNVETIWFNKKKTWSAEFIIIVIQK